MSKSIKVQLSKSLPNSKFEILLNSYTSLKTILSPNLSENNNSFMNSLFDLLISQLQIFLKLLSLNDQSKIYEILNSNNQHLSKQIATLYEFIKYNINSKLTVNSASEKERNDYNKTYNKKESYSLEEKVESFNENNSGNFEIDYNNLNTESKNGEKENYIKNKEINININDVNENQNINDNIIKNDVKYKTPKHFAFKERKNQNKFIKIDKLEKEKIELINSLNLTYKEKEKEKNTTIKPQKNLKKTKSKNNYNVNKVNKFIYKRNIVSPNNSIKSKKFINISTNTKKNDYSSFFIKNKNISKKLFKEKNNKINKDKTNNEYNKNTIQVIKSKNKKEKNIINEKFERKEKKSKTVIYHTIQIPYFFDLTASENDENNNFISITFSNKFLQGINTPKNIKRKSKSINTNNFKPKSALPKTNFKKIKKPNLNSPDYFSLDAFLIPQSGRGDKKLFFTKKGGVLINKNQKDILEDYVNNYLFEEEEEGKSEGTEKSVKDKLMNNIKSKKNKKFVIKGTSKHYNLKDVTDVLQILPTSFNGHIDGFYLRKKKASIFDRRIFKICHRVIDNYKKLEGKDDIFNYKKSHSQNKNKANERKNNNSNNNLCRHKNKTEGLFKKIF